MGAVRSLAILAAGAAIGGVALLAYRISQETGKPMQEALERRPGRGAAPVRRAQEPRAARRFEKGRAVYEEKQQELADQLREFTSAH